MSTYNRLARPIAVMGARAAYMHLCEHCGLKPGNNDVFVHIDTFEAAAAKGIEGFNRVLEIEGAEELTEYRLIKSYALSKVKGEATARPSNIGVDVGQA